MLQNDDPRDRTVVGPCLEVDAERVGGRKLQMKCKFEGRLIYSDTFDPHDAAARAKFGKGVVATVRERWGSAAVTIEQIERVLLDAAERAEAADKARFDDERAGDSGRSIETVSDPDRLARLFLDSECKHPDCSTLRSYLNHWYRWNGVCYVQVPEMELNAELAARIKIEFDRDSVEKRTAAGKVTGKLAADVRLALTSKILVPGNRDMPCWIGGGPWPVNEMLAANNGLFHLPSLADGVENQILPTPKFFSTFALEYDIFAKPQPPDAWLGFLNDLWPDEPGCIATLQEFMGYFLTSDTSQQKILLIVGPMRSGKGTIAKVVTGLVGARNVAGPTASGMKTNFGLQDLIGKPIAIIADAQMKKHDDGLVERLKMISGEDRITVDKKYADPVTVKLSTRLVIMSNDLPRFKDTSGALANRMIILRLTRSFIGREDTSLGARLLKERPGILAWAIAGWKRLNERRRFLQPESGQALLNELQDLSSSVGQFGREACLVDDPSAQTPRKTLYEAYLRWCVTKGHDHPFASNTFGAELRSVVPGLGDTHPMIEGKQVWCYTGVSIRAEHRLPVQVGP